MGTASSLTQQQVNQIQEKISFSQKQIKTIHKRFQKLDKINKGYVSYYDLLQIPEIQKHSLGERTAKLLSNSQYDPEIDFTNFIQTLDFFNKGNNGGNNQNTNISENNNSEEQNRLMFTFKVFDFDGDGLISKQDFISMFSLIVGGDLDEGQLNQIIELLLQNSDFDQDGKLNFEEFKKLVQQC